MNETDKRLRFWRGAVISLMVCNIALMLTVWLVPYLHHKPTRETPRDFVVRNLKFTDEQTRQYDLMVKDHQQAMRQLRQQAMEYRQWLFANLKNQHAGDNRYADSVAQMIANNQKQIEMVTYNHFAQVRALCTDAQKTEFDRIIGDVIKKMNGPGGPPHPPGDGPPPPGDDRNPPPPPGDGNLPPPGPQ